MYKRVVYVCLRLLDAAGWYFLCVSEHTQCVAIRVVANDDELETWKWCCTRSWFSKSVWSVRVCVCRKFTTIRKHNICITANATSPAARKIKRLSIVCFEFIPRSCTHTQTHITQCESMSISACTIQSRVDARVCSGISIRAFRHTLKAKWCAKLHLLNTWPNLLMICQALVTFYLFRAMKMNFPRHTSSHRRSLAHWWWWCALIVAHKALRSSYTYAFDEYYLVFSMRCVWIITMHWILENVDFAPAIWRCSSIRIQFMC